MNTPAEELAPVADGHGVNTLAENVPGDVDLLALCEIWRALDFAAPCHCDCERGKEHR